MNTDRYKKYKVWYSGLNVDQRNKLDFITTAALELASERLEDLNGNTLITQRNSPKSLSEFYRDELLIISNLMRQISLPGSLQRSELLGHIQYEIQNGIITGKDLYHLSGDQESKILNILVWQIITSGKLIDKYLNVDYSPDNIKSLEDFEKVIEILALSQYLLQINFLLKNCILNQQISEKGKGIWDTLYNDLHDSKYIDTSREVFNSVMEYKHLPGSAKKIKWLATKSDAVFFQKGIGLSMKQLNECFQNSDRKPFTEHNRLQTTPKTPLPEILKK